MNITLSADKELLKKARSVAARQGTSLNQMIRAYLEKVTCVSDLEEKAEEFAQLAREKAGASQPGFVFHREDAHIRGEESP